MRFRFSLSVELGNDDEGHEYSEISTDTDVTPEDYDEHEPLGFRGPRKEDV